MARFHWIGVVAVVALVLPPSDGLRCYECRSDIHRSCGDPFIPVHVPATECSLLSTNPVLLCYKSNQLVDGQWMTVRGCAPFNTETFDRGLQRGMGGTYWRGMSTFSLCDYDNCNAAPTLTISTGLYALTVASAILKWINAH